MLEEVVTTGHSLCKIMIPLLHQFSFAKFNHCNSRFGNGMFVGNESHYSAILLTEHSLLSPSLRI